MLILTYFSYLFLWPSFMPSLAWIFISLCFEGSSIVYLTSLLMPLLFGNSIAKRYSTLIIINSSLYRLIGHCLSIIKFDVVLLMQILYTDVIIRLILHLANLYPAGNLIMTKSKLSKGNWWTLRPNSSSIDLVYTLQL